VEEIMKRLCLGLIVAIGLTVPAFGQASLKEQLVGTWTLVSCSSPDNPICAGNNGMAMHAANGRYISMVAGRGRPKVTNPGQGRNAPSPEEYKAIASGLFAQFGTWSVNEANKTITHHADGALFPNIEGIDGPPITISMSGDELRFTAPNGSSVYRRVRD
jgi:hypothetical protein